MALIRDGLAQNDVDTGIVIQAKHATGQFQFLPELTSRNRRATYAKTRHRTTLSELRPQSAHNGADQVGFAVLPRRWVVERFFAWINRNRQLAKDFEGTVASVTAFLHAAAAMLLVRRLARLG
jgi:Transposase DDE domain